MGKIRWTSVGNVAGHILFWLAYIYYQGIIYHWQDTDDLNFQFSIHTSGIPILVTILLTYVNLYVLLPLFYYRLNWQSYSTAVIATLLIGAVLTRFLTHQFVIPWEQVNDPERYAKEVKNFWIPSRIVRLAVQYYPVVAILTLFELMGKAYRTEKHMRQLERERTVAELNFLKAQVNPHFFFNTLNVLYALILRKSDDAAELVLRLSGLMRYVLDKTQAEYVDLATEIAELENYLNIEKQRFADRLDLSFHYSGDIETKQIIPLILLPFVENAFKHGIDEGPTWIVIQLKVTGQSLYYRVENSKSVKRTASASGIGLPNLRRRLAFAYPGRSEINIKDLPDVFEALLKIEL